MREHDGGEGPASGRDVEDAGDAVDLLLAAWVHGDAAIGDVVRRVVRGLLADRAEGEPVPAVLGGVEGLDRHRARRRRARAGWARCSARLGSPSSDRPPADWLGEADALGDSDAVAEEPDEGPSASVSGCRPPSVSLVQALSRPTVVSAETSPSRVRTASSSRWGTSSPTLPGGGKRQRPRDAASYGVARRLVWSSLVGTAGRCHAETEETGTEEATGHGRFHPLPPQRRDLGRPGQRRTPRAVGPAHALPRLVGARPGEPRHGRGPLDRAADAGEHARRGGAPARRRPPGRRPDPGLAGRGRRRDHGGARDAALGRAGAPVVRRRGAGGVPAPAGRRPPGPRLGPGGGDRERPAAGPDARPRGRRLVRRAGGDVPQRGCGGRTSGRRGGR